MYNKNNNNNNNDSNKLEHIFKDLIIIFDKNDYMFYLILLQITVQQKYLSSSINWIINLTLCQERYMYQLKQAILSQGRSHFHIW